MFILLLVPKQAIHGTMYPTQFTPVASCRSPESSGSSPSRAASTPLFLRHSPRLGLQPRVLTVGSWQLFDNHGFNPFKNGICPGIRHATYSYWYNWYRCFMFFSPNCLCFCWLNLPTLAGQTRWTPRKFVVLPMHSLASWHQKCCPSISGVELRHHGASWCLGIKGKMIQEFNLGGFNP